MKKIIFAIIICVTTSFVGCSPQKDSRVAINFGEAQYKEPFRGILASKPDILVKSLDWPVIKLFKPDTAIVCRTIEFSFNEDAVRSNAIAEISLLGTSFQPNSNIQWYVNNTPLIDGKFTIKATLESQQIELKGKIHPIVGNKKLSGYLTLLSNDLDEVNSIQLTSDVNSIADWTCTHEYGWPIVLWLVWLILILLIVAIIAGVLYLLGYMFVAIGKVFYCYISSIHMGKQRQSNDKITKQNDANKDNLKSFIWLQEKGDQNQLLQRFKIGMPKTIPEEYLQPYLYWESKDYIRARKFKRGLQRFIRLHYHSYFRIRFKLEPLLNPDLPYIWIGTTYKNHFRKMSIIKYPADEKHLKNCLYFHNTKIGNKRAQKLLNELNTYINENY